jgi:hypothetical protein
MTLVMMPLSLISLPMYHLVEGRENAKIHSWEGDLILERLERSFTALCVGVIIIGSWRIYVLSKRSIMIYEFVGDSLD